MKRSKRKVHKRKTRSGRRESCKLDHGTSKEIRERANSVIMRIQNKREQREFDEKKEVSEN